MNQADTDNELDKTWWKEAVVYEVYPRSFNDTDGDGVGDIPGITEKADYFDDLGVDVLWVGPVYDSPNADNGYDIRNYREIHDDFGDMRDWERLLSALHDRDIRLIMDLVVNHTSNEHEWFQRSRRREGPYEDYYHWVDGDPDEPPNNWESIFGGPAWTYDEERGQWYLHLFHEKQPDLNWRVPAVRKDIYEMVNLWLDKGIDGFRLDAINLLSKPAGYPDGDPESGLLGNEHYFNGPRIHEYLRELHDETFAGRDVMTVAEMSHITPADAEAYCGPDGDGLDMTFQFVRDGMDSEDDGRWASPDWALSDLKRVLASWQQTAGAWVAPCLGNHDQPRSVSWWGDESYRVESATLLATFLLTLRGTPHVYQGEEIGMTNAEFERLDEIDDPDTLQRVELAIEAGEADGFDDLREAVNEDSRDHARTPMQWSADDHAGFTDGEPWLRVNDDYPEVNVESALADESSIWYYYRDLIRFRHEETPLVYGDFDLLLPDHGQFCAYTRTLEAETLLIVLNWSDAPATFECDAVETADSDALVANYDDPPENPAATEFRPYEAAVYRL
ncbi:alpha-glucosidase [Haloarcula sp. S1AR25-5A]|uniref:Alpha-glucosidase n=1 Tax=Haloarcula terrestris TaxID=2950533 RepID=A0AAE4EWY0_9EURY|nr:alpha-glucosidase [Haloarcula terrestris]MDS0221558.1 alpha-glucosidase [Haloarcula terrestris]